jgi:hypothetical protein
MFTSVPTKTGRTILSDPLVIVKSAYACAIPSAKLLIHNLAEPEPNRKKPQMTQIFNFNPINLGNLWLIIFLPKKQEAS